MLKFQNEPFIYRRVQFGSNIDVGSKKMGRFNLSPQLRGEESSFLLLGSAL